MSPRKLISFLRVTSFGVRSEKNWISAILYFKINLLKDGKIMYDAELSEINNEKRKK